MPEQDDTKPKDAEIENKLEEATQTPAGGEPSDEAEDEEASASDENVDTEYDAAESDSHELQGERAELGDAEQIMSDNQPPKRPGKFKRFFAGYWHKKKWTLPLTLLAILAIIFAVPATRYPVLALKMKRQFETGVFDSKTHAPATGARVTLDGKTLTTNNIGVADFNAKVGRRTVTVSKKYYKSFSESVFVGVNTKTNAQTVHLAATGRQVPVKVVNKITGKPVADAEIKVLDTEAKTDANGQASIVLPTSAPTQSATITASGYNDGTGKVQVTSSIVAANTFQLTPSGRVYFLSNLSGNIDVVSTNLDGSGRKTVLAGTGNEDPNNTALLATTDWKYLALLSKRDGGQNAKLFLINTSSGQVTTMDEGAATFTPVGWEGHSFVYQAQRTNVPVWQSGQASIKSFNAETGRIVTLDQTTGSGSSEQNYTSQDFGYSDIYAIDNQVVYIKEWSQGPNAAASALNGKQDQILASGLDGGNKQVLKNISVTASAGYQSINSFAYNPAHVYFQVINNAGSTYYDYTGGSVTQSSTITDNSYQQGQQEYATYLLSPSGNQTFWAEPRDGKNTLFVGDANGANGKQIATLSDYTTYGWYTDNYLLVEKGGSELYVMSTTGAAGPGSSGAALKISDYYKPTRNFNGYGGGYGGL